MLLGRRAVPSGLRRTEIRQICGENTLRLTTEVERDGSRHDCLPRILAATYTGRTASHAALLHAGNVRHVVGIRLADVQPATGRWSRRCAIDEARICVRRATSSSVTARSCAGRLRGEEGNGGARARIVRVLADADGV